jgi:putative transposase
MRLPASEKLEIIGLVEQSHLPARRTLQMLGIKPSTFYRWYDRFRSGGPEALEDKPSKPDRVWNRIPDDIRQRVVMMWQKSGLTIESCVPGSLGLAATEVQLWRKVVR